MKYIKWIFVYLATALFLALPFICMKNNSAGNMVEAEERVVNDTILVANDSIEDALRVKYGLQVMEVGYRKVNYTDVGGHGTDFFIKIKNLRHEMFDGRCKLSYKAVDPKTNEVLVSDDTYLRFNKISSNEIVQLEPYISWTHIAGKKYILYLWIEDIPMKSIEVKFQR